MLLVRLSACLLCLGGVLPANILMLTLGGTRSHKVPFLALGPGLVSKGHRVTLVSAFPSGTHSPLEEVNPTKVVETVKRFSNVDILGPRLRGNIMAVSILDIIDYCNQVCEAFYTSEETQLLLSWKVDLLILDGAFPDCLLGLVHHFHVPFVYLNTVAMYPVQFSLSGSPAMYSVTPFFDSRLSDRMNFFERSANALYYTVNLCVVTIIRRMYIDPLIRKYVDSEAPPNDEIGRNVSVILQNGHHSVTYPRPFLPGVVEIACIHCNEPKPLPKDLEDFVTGGRKKGFIYVSFGTSVQSSQMPESLRSLMVQVFRQLPYQVLWKNEGDQDSMPDLPDNVKLGRWLPQQDLLGHKNILAFVNHGGLHSVIEAAYHAVPMVTLPVFCDHLSNSRKAEDDGYAVMVDLYSMTASTLLEEIKKVIEEKSFKEAAELRSAILRDQPEPPLDRALYWVQYVLRHKGAHHLHSAAKDLNFIQYFMLDTLAAVIVMVYCLIHLLKALWQQAFRRKHKKLKTN